MQGYLVGLVGTGIGPSLTPPLHEREADELGLRYLYRRLDLDRLELPPEAIGNLLTAVRLAGYDGVNVTHPCKQLVLPHLDELTADAQALGAVNTVVLRGGRAVGHNTDWSGFARAFDRGLHDADLNRVVLLGAGGAGAAVAHALLTLGTGRLTVLDVDARRARTLAPAPCPPPSASGAAPAGPPARTSRGSRHTSPRPTVWCTRRRPGWSPIPACPCPQSCCGRSSGWPTSSTAPWRPRWSVPPGRPAAGCST